MISIKTFGRLMPDPFSVGEAAGFIYTISKTVVKLSQNYGVSGRLRVTNKRIRDSTKIIEVEQCMDFIMPDEWERFEMQIETLREEYEAIESSNDSHFNPKVIYRAFSVARSASLLKDRAKKVTSRALVQKLRATYAISSANQKRTEVANGNTLNSAHPASEDFSMAACTNPCSAGFISERYPAKEIGHILITFRDGTTQSIDLKPVNSLSDTQNEPAASVGITLDANPALRPIVDALVDRAFDDESDDESVNQTFYDC